MTEILLHSFLAVLLVLVAAGGWVMSLLGLPGNWVMIAAAGLYAWLGPQTGRMDLGWQAIGVMVGLAVAGELVETVASVWGARRAGGSRRAAVFAMLGSLAGAIVGAVVGVPIPVIGSAVAAVMGGALGALVGAAVAERSIGESPEQSFRVGQAAFWGRLLGTGAKTAVATVIAVMCVVSLIV